MICRKSLVNNGRGSAQVFLNVYDLTSFNGYAHWLGLGVYHSGVQVHGVEYAFGAHEQPTTGIFESKPKQYDGFTFRKSILIGWTDVTPAQVKAVMEELAKKYRGNAYNLISKNCNHFCNDACRKLTGNPIPKWVNRLARIGVLCKCIIPENLNLTKVHQPKTQKKLCDLPKKPRGQSKRLSNNSSSNSTSSSSCSPPLPATSSSRSSCSPPIVSTLSSRSESSVPLCPPQVVTRA